ncbi:glycosyltransferase, partial [Megasphaera cerevisiae]|uniref:glycosyltransferase n=1 Tax=Megasphaera cerevisiae TaxID=39029 RepID=UPI0009645229
MVKTIVMLTHYGAQPKYIGDMRYHDWAKYLIRKGFTVYIFCSSVIHSSTIDIIDDESSYKIIDDEGINYVYVKTTKCYANGLSRIKNMFSYYFKILRVVPKVVTPDIIIARTPNPLACVAGIKLASKYGIACISDIVDLWPESIVVYKHISKKNFLIKLLYKGEKWIYKHSSALIFSMPGYYKYIEERNMENIISKDKCFY